MPFETPVPSLTLRYANSDLQRDFRGFNMNYDLYLDQRPYSRGFDARWFWWSIKITFDRFHVRLLWYYRGRDPAGHLVRDGIYMFPVSNHAVQITLQEYIECVIVTAGYEDAVKRYFLPLVPYPIPQNVPCDSNPQIM